MSAAKLRLRLGGKLLWNPMDLGPNVMTAWYNPDLHGNTSYMTDDGAGLISSFSGMVNKNALAATTTGRPTWTAAAWAPTAMPTKAGLTFSASAAGPIKVNPTGIPLGATPGMMFALFQPNTITGGQHVIGFYGDTAAGANGRYMYTSDATFRVSDNSTVKTAATTLAANSYNIGCAYWSGTTIGLRLNGAADETTTIASLNTSTIRLGMGRNSGGSGQFAGVISHYLITTLLAAADVLRMEGFLAWYGWNSGAANPLPVTHIYKYQAP